MKGRLRKIVQKTTVFSGECLKTIRKVVAGIVLPRRNRRGNLLSSIFMLFVEIADLITHFSWEISFDKIHHWKYYKQIKQALRQGVILIGCFLFLLSSVEWYCGMENCEQVTIVHQKYPSGISGITDKVSAHWYLYPVPFCLLQQHHHPTRYYTLYSRPQPVLSILLLYGNFRL